MKATNPLRREIKIGRLEHAIERTYNTDKKKIKSQIRSI